MPKIDVHVVGLASDMTDNLYLDWEGLVSVDLARISVCAVKLYKTLKQWIINNRKITDTERTSYLSLLN